jgi:arginase family enzyme
VGSPEGGGIRAGALIQALHRASRHTEFTGVEIAEYNPELDRGGVTADVACDLLVATHSVEQRRG